MKSLGKKSGCLYLVFLAAFLWSNYAATAQPSIYAYRLYRSAGNVPVAGLSIAVDSNTNGYIAARFSDTLTVSNRIVTNSDGWPNVLLSQFRYGTTNAPQWMRAPTTDYTIANARVGADNSARGAGYLSGSFGGTNLTFGTTTITNNATDHSNDIFLAKYDNNGNLIFLDQAGGTGNDLLGDEATDTSGNTCLTGAFFSPVFTAGTSSLTLQNTGGNDCFIIKYDTSGGVTWLDQGSYASGNCVAFDPADNCYVGGTVSGPAVFSGVSPASQTTGNFLAKYSSSGSLAWVRGDDVVGSYLKADKAQSIYTAGVFSNVVQFGSVSLTNSAPSTIYVAKYDLNGNILWAQQVPGLGCDGVTGMAIDTHTNCWVSGYFASPASPTNTIFAVARYDQFGVLNGLSQAGSHHASSTGGIATGGAPFPANVLVLGTYSTNFSLSSPAVLTNGGNTDLFMAWVFVNPVLASTVSTTNIVSAWPMTDGGGYVLQTNSSLGSGWNSAGSGSLVNGQFVITNSIGGNAKFFRLIKAN
jgi:hypothetical protein